jgi:hypothetical protein
MTVFNLTPHDVNVYNQGQFIGLEQTNPTTWVADGVEGAPIALYPSNGVARIATKTVPFDLGMPGECVETSYGDANGIPDEATAADVFIVSLPMQSMSHAAGHPLASNMVAPYKVVRLRTDGSKVLGCMGFTR